MLVPSTFTGWYRKMIIKAEIPREIDKSRSQIDTTGLAGERRTPAAAGGVTLSWSDICLILYRQAEFVLSMGLPGYCRHENQGTIVGKWLKAPTMRKCAMSSVLV